MSENELLATAGMDALVSISWLSKCASKAVRESPGQRQTLHALGFLWEADQQQE
jgi:hypothetical protein